MEGGEGEVIDGRGKMGDGIGGFRIPSASAGFSKEDSIASIRLILTLFSYAADCHMVFPVPQG